jgi:hypothetical protein
VLSARCTVRLAGRVLHPNARHTGGRVTCSWTIPKGKAALRGTVSVTVTARGGTTATRSAGFRAT